MGTPLDSVLFTLRPLMVMVTIRITAMGVDTIAAGEKASQNQNTGRGESRPAGVVLL